MVSVPHVSSRVPLHPPDVPSTLSQPLSPSIELVTISTRIDIREPVTPTDSTQHMERLVMFFMKCLSMPNQGKSDP